MMEKLSVDQITGCRCKRFSCEPVTIKLGNGEFAIDPNRRFRFVKDEREVITNITKVDGVEYKGGPTDNNILDCEFRGRTSSCVIRYKDSLGYPQKIKTEQEKEEQNKKERKKKPKKKKGKWKNL